MKESKEIDIGLNKLAATMVTVGLGSMGMMVFGDSTGLVIVPVMVVVVGLAICTRSFWWRR